jgi:predicted RNase H-like nuclease (RuvC/YqgF family)
MPERFGIGQWVGGLVTTALLGFVVLGTYLMLTQHQLNAVQVALTTARDEAVRARTEAAKLTKTTEDLETELKALRTRHKVLKGRAANARAAIAELNKKLDAAELKFQERQSQLRDMEARLSDAKRALAKLGAEAIESENKITKLRQGNAGCEEFSHEWENAGSPVSLAVIAALGREAAAAKDCISTGKVAMACKHWQGLLMEIESVGPPVSESRSEIEQLMRQHGCEAEGNFSLDDRQADP